MRRLATLVWLATIVCILIVSSATVACIALAKGEPAPDDGVTDVLEHSCLAKEMRVIDSIKPNPTASSEVILYFKRPNSKKLDHFRVLEDKAVQVGIKKGMKVCWVDESKDSD